MPIDSAKPTAWYGERMTTLMQYLADGRLHPLIARCYPLKDAEHAHRSLEDGGDVRKVVLET